MRLFFSTLVLIFATAACNEPVVFDPQSGQDPTPDMTDAGEVDPTPDVPDTGTPEVGMQDTGSGGEIIDPDREFYAAVIRPMMIENCTGAPICHQAGSFGRTFLTSTDVEPPAAKVDEDLANLQMFIDYQTPSQSSALLKSVADPSCCEEHPLIYSVEGENYQTILRWIEDSVRVEGEDPEPDPEPEPDAGVDEGVPCDSLPDPVSLPGGYDFDTFQDNINPLLVERCARIGGCHSVPGNGGGLWFLRDGDECSITWNYLGVRWFINPSGGEVENSPILSEPLGQQQANDLHGGSVVFRGRDDCGYVKIKLWIEGSFESLPVECR